MNKKKIIALSAVGVLVGSISLSYAAPYLTNTQVKLRASGSTVQDNGTISKTFAKEAAVHFSNEGIKFDNITVDNLTGSEQLSNSNYARLEFKVKNAKFKNTTYKVYDTSNGSLITGWLCSLGSDGTTITCNAASSDVKDNITLSSGDNITINSLNGEKVEFTFKAYRSVDASNYVLQTTQDNWTTSLVPNKWITVSFAKNKLEPKIDVNQERKKFVNNTDNKTDLHVNFSTVDLIPITSGKKWKLTLTADLPGAFYYQADNDSTSSVSWDNFTAGSTNYTYNKIESGTYTGSNTYGVQIVPDGVMNPGSYNVSLSFDTGISGVTAVPDNDTVKFDIGINGAQLRAPYLFNNELSWIRITNNHNTMDAEITADLIDEFGNKVTGISVGTVNKNSSILVRANELIAKAKAKSGTPSNFASNGRFTADFIVAAPSDVVSAVSVVKITSSSPERFFPVLKYNDQTKDYQQ